MSLKTLKKYQEKAVDKLISRTKELFHENVENKTIIFQAPTGSGKTFMMARYIKEIIDELPKEDICFLWISIGKGELHKQSYENLKKEFGYFPRCSLLEEAFFGSRRVIDRNEVVVVNWEKLRVKDGETGEWKNILMKDKETYNFREVIKYTKEECRFIVMIIDESHSNSTSERALELRDDIVNPNLTIEMSATPSLAGFLGIEQVIVPSNDVIEEGMIKKEIIINENIDKISDGELESQQLILEAAFQKRMELKNIFNNENIEVNPLVLIQLPIGEQGDEKKDFIEKFFAERCVTYENRKLSVWLSEEKINTEKEFVIQNRSQVEFLIFKQAIDTGWDCPRAQILVRFREIKSLVFEIQTVGRILRMPEAHHYKNDILNKGYVYTNVKSIDVKRETYNPNIIKSIFVKRNEKFSPIKLTSYYKNRIDYGDITANFYYPLEEVFCAYFNIKKGSYEFFDQNKEQVKKKINIENLDNRDEIILNENIQVKLIDQLNGKTILGSTNIEVNLSQDDLFYLFENLIRVNLNGYAQKRSIPIVKQSIYKWFSKYLGIAKNQTALYPQNVCLNNNDIFSQLIDESVRKYEPYKLQEIKEKDTDEENWNDEWQISESKNYNPYSYERYDHYKKYFYSPVYVNFKTIIGQYNKLELEFSEFLEKSENVLWWWKNGQEHMESNFGIKYINIENKASTFQPDFIVAFKDNRIGIFDTKASGEREDNNKLKNEALQIYIIENDKNIIGGLVVKEGDHFRLNNKINYKSFKEKQEDWIYIKDLI